MPPSPKKLCPGCNRAIIEYDQARCTQCKANAPARPRKIGDPFYASKRWRALRAQKLAESPLCECQDCVRMQRVLPATTVDHVVERKDDPSREFDYSNLMAMATGCHNRKTARERHRRDREGA